MNAGVTPVRRFGQGAIATRANFVTIARLIFAVPLLILIYHRGAEWATVGGWFVLSITDGLDGVLARRDGTTRSGAFLDPLADKCLVLGGFGVLVARGDVWWLPVALIAAREIAVSVFRSLAARRGRSLPARRLGKLKTVVQLLAVGAVLLPWTADAHTLQVTILWFAVALTLASAADLFLHTTAVSPTEISEVSAP